MLALKDSRHIVDTNAFRLGRRCWPMESPVDAEKKAMKAIKILSSPDTRRVEKQDFDGRRIEKVDGGYLILNGQLYEDLMRDVSRKVYKARKEREYRNNRKLKIPRGPIAGETAAVKAFADGHVDKDFQPVK
jgi:hypothetical protein